MDNPLENLLRQHLPITKNTKGGWEKFDAPCCTHNGEGRDKRSRGNIIFSSSGISYNCYNCQYRASWKGGSPIVGKKMSNLLSWLGASSDEIRDMKVQMRSKFQGNEKAYKDEYRVTYVNFDFPEMDLPKGAKSLDYYLKNESPETPFCQDLCDVFVYMSNRGSHILEKGFYWSPEPKYRRQIIIPFYWEDKIVGYTLRNIDKDASVRYLNYKPKNYLFNTEYIKDRHDYIIVVEGVLDAVAINAVGLLGASVTEEQACWLNQQGKKIIIYGDNDRNGEKLKYVARRHGWFFVSELKGEKRCKDAAELSKEYGAACAVAKILDAYKKGN